MVKQSYFYQVLFALLLLLLINSSVVATEPKIAILKIGLFNLLKPKTIDIEVVTDEIVAINSQESSQENHSKVLLLEQSLTLVAKSNKITCYLKNSQKTVIKNGK
ncbi:MAG: hypothetical protein IPK14_00885 [Blastocatellia bacterium]|nr:hypothetical protein [Blastocatellia bacterium]